MSLLLPDPEQSEHDGVQLPVNVDTPLSQAGQTLLRHISAVCHVELGQFLTILPHHADTSVSDSPTTRDVQGDQIGTEFSQTHETIISYTVNIA